MDAAANFLIKPIFTSSETVVRISSSKSRTRRQSLGGVQPHGSSGAIESSQDWGVWAFVYWTPSRPFPSVNVQSLTLSLNNALHNRIFWMGTNESSGSSRECNAKNNGLNQICFLLQTPSWLWIVTAYLLTVASFLWKKSGLLIRLSSLWNDKLLHPSCQ